MRSECTCHFQVNIFSGTCLNSNFLFHSVEPGTLRGYKELSYLLILKPEYEINFCCVKSLRIGGCLLDSTAHPSLTSREHECISPISVCMCAIAQPVFDSPQPQGL